MSAVEIPQEGGEETQLPELDPSDAKHIRETYPGLQAEARNGTVYFKSKRKVGAVGVPSGANFYIRPKVECSLLHMLALSEQLDENIVFDAEEASLELGGSFVDLIAHMFINELRRIFRRGLDQQYDEKQEQKRHLRGRLDLQRQLQNGPGTTTFECVFDELTHDTLPNQFLYHAAYTLRDVASGEALTRQLRRNCRQLEAAFKPRPLSQIRRREPQLSHLNRYYERGIELAEFILKERYVQGFARQHRDLSSFTVDLPNTFENAVYYRLKQAVNLKGTSVNRDGLGALAENSDTEKTRKLYPDFIFRNQDTDEPLLVGDMKWKKSDENSEADDEEPEKNQKVERNDLYQMFAYQSKAQSPGLLIYPDDGQQLPHRYEYQVGQMDFPLYILKIDVSDDGYERTKDRIDNALREKVSTILSRHESVQT